MFISKIISFFLAILCTISPVFSGIAEKQWFGEEKYKVEDAENILLDIALISDTHSSSEFLSDQTELLRRVICGISHTDRIPDALVIAGDISNATDKKEYRMLARTLKSFNKTDFILPATGNHDVRAGDNYEEAVDYFTDFAARCGVKTDKTYYSKYIKGYPFIILGSEDMSEREAYISDEQLCRFENELKTALDTGKPVFVICHQPLYNSNNVFYDPDAEKHWGVGEQSEKLTEILNKYVPSAANPVFFISGHLHRNFSEYSFDDKFCDNLYCVNIPSVTKTENGGLGMTMEVYSDKILLRAINYLTMEQPVEFRYSVPLN